MNIERKRLAKAKRVIAMALCGVLLLGMRPLAITAKAETGQAGLPVLVVAEDGEVLPAFEGEEGAGESTVAAEDDEAGLSAPDEEEEPPVPDEEEELPVPDEEEELPVPEDEEELPVPEDEDEDPVMEEDEPLLTEPPLTTDSNNIDLADGGIADGTAGAGWIYHDNVYTIADGASVTVTGDNSGSERRIEIAAGATASMVLNNVTVTGLGEYQSPLLLNDGATLNLAIEGFNKLAGGFNSAGIQVPEGTALSIDGRGIYEFLEVIGGVGAPGTWDGGAGIGGGNGQNCGTITIYNIMLIASTSTGAHEIGPGFRGKIHTTITIDAKAYRSSRAYDAYHDGNKDAYSGNSGLYTGTGASYPGKDEICVRELKAIYDNHVKNQEVLGSP
ncbi:MAG: hypothetical protein LBI54_01630 [Lachnospiraceae bacterium]|jgi:hypothetical protein|nr:hypothetical protein [Lachnospiraceae bacterium]